MGGSRQSRHNIRNRTFIKIPNAAEKRKAGSRALDTLLAIYGSSKRMSAQDFCILCHYMSVCDVPGADWGKYASPPGKPSGSYKSHLDRRLPSSGPYYYADMPMRIRKQAHISSQRVPFRQVFRTIADEVKADPYVRDMLEEGREDDFDSILSLPSYLQNPIVQESMSRGGPLPLPLAVYMDGVRYAGQAAGRTDVQAHANPTPQDTLDCAIARVCARLVAYPHVWCILWGGERREFGKRQLLWWLGAFNCGVRGPFDVTSGCGCDGNSVGDGFV
eukprot:9477927-Pyramimonas_sp.AAC.3